MMAAARILIWLPVSVVRRSRISNMAFPLRRLFMSERVARLHPAYIESVSSRRRRRQAHDDAEHMCIEAMEGLILLRTNRKMTAIDLLLVLRCTRAICLRLSGYHHIFRIL